MAVGQQLSRITLEQEQLPEQAQQWIMVGGSAAEQKIISEQEQLPEQAPACL
jgi:hypothetical protein